MSTSVSATSTNGTTSIDVASIVSGLMTIANKPLDTLNTKITNDQAVISDFGILKSKLSAFQTALNAFETPGSYQNVSTAASNSSIVAASANTGAQLGRYSLNITQTAEASNISVSGFLTAKDAVTLGVNGFEVTIGAKTYFSNVPNVGSVSGVTTPALTSGTISDVNNWINAIAVNNGANISSNIVQQSAGQFALVISGTKTGITNSLGFAGLNGRSVVTTNNISTSSSVAYLNGAVDNSGNPVSINSTARDSLLTVNGLQFQRSSNSVNDVVNNVTFNIGSTGSGLVTVNQGTDNSSTLINNFITTYNAMLAQYKTMTANSRNSSSGTATGSIGSQSAALTLSFVDDIKNSIGQGALLGTNYISLATMGIDYQIDGTLKFNQTNYNQGISSGILSSLSQGVAVGGQVGSTRDLAKILTTALNPDGSISSYIKTENQDITNTQSKILTLKDQLQTLQSSYTQQYSALNTLLYNLSQTSNQLTSSLTAITNINASK